MINKYLVIFFIVGLSLSISCKKSQVVRDGAEVFADSLIRIMTPEEKLGQLTLYASGWDVTGPSLNENYIEDIRNGKCGNLLNAYTVAYNTRLQKIAVEESRLGIPLLFGYDVIHGHKTIFPIPLAEACSWNLELMEKSTHYAAMEAAAAGINWTFAPMVDISRDPRWGRVAEGAGEDPYLGSLIAAARVKGFQGEDLADPLTIASCIKHFAAYGASMAGRDYNSVDMSGLELRQNYIPPYKAGIDAGAVTVMASFNDLFGVPATCSEFLLTDILREEYNFRGIVVSDYTAVQELINHGMAPDEKFAAEISINAGTDMDMQSGAYIEYLAKSVEEGKVSKETIDEAVKRVLIVKYKLGLFHDPYLYLDEKREQEITGSDEILEHALQAAKESVVLLKNDDFRGKKILPVSKDTKRIAVIGPLGDSQIDMLGCWHAAGDATKAVSLLQGLKKEFPTADISFTKACDFYSDDKSGFAEAMRLAAKADLVVVAIGEKEAHSGEASSRSMINIPGLQEELALELIKTGKPVVVIIMAERPLTFPKLSDTASSILYAWHLGTRAGDAIADILSGDYNPSAKLVMTLPRTTGQIPVFYNHKNTGRPFEADIKYTTKYLDVSNEPQYPFGFGLSYTSFEYSPLTLSSDEIGMDDTLTITIKVKNTGNYDGEEIVQLYIRDMVGSITRPVKELKGFKKVLVKRGDEIQISFKLCAEDLRFYDAALNFVAEPGDFKVFIGSSSESLQEKHFVLKDR